MTINGLTNYKQAEQFVDASDKPLVLIKTLKRITERLTLINSYIDAKNYEKKYLELSKVRQVIEILCSSVDVNYGEISKNLISLYVYIIKLLDMANIGNDKKAINECIALIATLYEGFVAAYEKEKKPAIEEDAHMERKELKGSFQGYSTRNLSRAEFI